MPYTYRKIAQKLKKQGYEILRQGKGSHVVFGKGKNRIIVPNHGGQDISPGVEKKIVDLLKMDKDSFQKL
jgi:predicted RNA binding protein YcfA (HicA-like mRNA interferase family)